MRLVRYANKTPFDTAFDRFCNLPALERLFDAETSNGSTELATRSPRTNIAETDDGYEFAMEMPGVSKKDVEIAIEKDRLVIRGGAEKKSEEKTENLVRREFQSERFERSFGIGSDVDRDKIAAKMDNGVLTVTVPKAASYVGRRIEIA